MKSRYYRISGVGRFKEVTHKEYYQAAISVRPNIAETTYILPKKVEELMEPGHAILLGGSAYFVIEDPDSAFERGRVCERSRGDC